jgi:diguanylate cyclase (GGDEF)-like protein
MISIDIDYFRSVNDAYGYKLGDLVLKQFAQRLKKTIRMHDYIIRFGDEEFVIILPGNDKKNALDLGRRISDSIKMFTFGDGKNSVRLRVSMAVVSYPEDGLSRSSEFIEIAEKILSRAKEYGGDRVCTIQDIRDDKALSRKITNIKHLKQELIKLTKKANQSSIESIFAFAKTIELKDHYTGNHVEKTVYYANEIAKRLKLPAEEIRFIEQASMLHDLGKIGISEKILLKKGPLTRREFDKIKNHPKIGADIIRPIQFFHSLLPLILYHHERWDGKGYPFGLKGNDIPIGARIIAIADVYEALISDRSYRKALSKKQAMKIIKENSGKQFDPKIADVLMEVLEKREV